MPLTLESVISLANGVRMPRLGLGTYKSAEGGDVEGAVETALRLGYRHLDTASFYGNEIGVGRAVASSEISRSDLFITTKVWNDEQGFENVLSAAHRSLERLDTDYIDLYLVHWPIPRLMEATWRAMEQLLYEKRVRAIGVCNFLMPHLEQLDSIAEAMPVVNQFEFHARLQQPELVEACRARDIVVEAWAPLMRGRVAEIEEVRRLAEHHDKSAAQIAVRWILQRGIATIPKSVREQRIAENADVFDFELSDEEMGLLDSLDEGTRIGPDPNSFAV